MCFFVVKQKTSYEMRISDWSSDVCSSDLQMEIQIGTLAQAVDADAAFQRDGLAEHHVLPVCDLGPHAGVAVDAQRGDRKSVVSGKSVSVRVAFGGRRINKKTKQAANKHDINIM